MSTTSDTASAAFVAADTGDLVQAADWASSMWWNGQFPISSAAVGNDFGYDYIPATSYEVDTSGPFYGVPAVMSGSVSQWSTVATIIDEETLDAAAPVPSMVDPTGQAAIDYAMLECCAPVPDPSQTLWTPVHYTDSISTVSGFPVDCSAPMPPVSMDYCNSLQMMQYGASFNGFAMSNSNKFSSEQIRHHCDALFDKSISTQIFVSFGEK